MTDRIKKLRDKSLTATNSISTERARLLTDFYSQDKITSLPIPIQRAKAFEYILNNKDIYIEEDELIVGERGQKPKATPTYPEISLHSIEDLKVLNSREKVSYKVADEDIELYKNYIIPFWEGKSQREHIFAAMSNEWKDAYNAGVFTEFQEQRAPGHTVAGGKIYKMGMLDFINQIDKKLNSKNITQEQTDELTAMKIVAKAAIFFAERHAERLSKLSETENDINRKAELEEMINICRNVPANAPQTFHEALQHYWFIHVGVITELNPWDSFNPGRLDIHLLPFYRKGLADGSLTKEKAQELLQAFWIKFNNHPAPPKVGVTALESNTYTDFALINMGGLNTDGTDAVNEVSFLMLDVIEEMRLLQPSSMVQISEKNPDEFIKRALKIVKTGFGQPSFFNTDEMIAEMLRQGKSIEDARNGGASGCVETGAFGTEAYTLSGYFNLNKVLELTLFNGYDNRTEKQIGLKTGEFSNFKSYNEFYSTFEKQLQYFIDIKIEGNKTIEKLFAERMPAPFLSLIIDDCIDNAKDYNAGGARYNTSYIQGVGLGSICNNLSAIKKHIFENQTISSETMIQALENNFEGYNDLRYKLVFESPKWGNNDDNADQQAVDVFNSFFKTVDGRPNYRNGVFRINMLPTTSHVYFGSVIGAMPDGRLKGKPLSEGISPVQGTDTKGPTAVILSCSKIDHTLTGGTLLNQKFTPDFFKDEVSYDKLCALIRSYFALMGHHIQFNVVDADTLRDAQKHPQDYRDLIVRVAGYSDYFNDLGTDLQNEIIERTEQN